MRRALSAAGRIIEERAAVGRKRKAHLGMRHGETLHDIDDGCRLGAFGLQKFETRRRGGEERARLDPRAARPVRGGKPALLAGFDTDREAMRGVCARACRW